MKRSISDVDDTKSVDPAVAAAAIPDRATTMEQVEQVRINGDYFYAVLFGDDARLDTFIIAIMEIVLDSENSARCEPPILRWIREVHDRPRSVSRRTKLAFLFAALTLFYKVRQWVSAQLPPIAKLHFGGYMSQTVVPSFAKWVTGVTAFADSEAVRHEQRVIDVLGVLSSEEAAKATTPGTRRTLPMTVAAPDRVQFLIDATDIDTASMAPRFTTDMFTSVCVEAYVTRCCVFIPQDAMVADVYERIMQNGATMHQ